MIRTLLIALASFLTFQQSIHAAVTVHLDFTSDLHNGAGVAGANGIPDWIEELDQANTIAGTAIFSPAERTTIESNILSQLTTTYTGYSVSFTPILPGGAHDTIYFGVEAGAGVLGFAPLDMGNLFTDQTTNVAPNAFSFIIESGDTRADMISEMSFAISGTAAHELGHSFGLLHHHAYSNAGITPANYAATGGLQNSHVIATGSTGLSELGRETLRTFSPFEKVMFDITGGARSVFGGQDNDSIVAGGILSDRTEDLGSDAGSTLATAQVLTLTTGTTSGQKIAFVEADLDVSGSDIDLFKFTAGFPGTLSAHVYSSDLVYGSGSEFDPILELLDSTGAVLNLVDDVMYSGNVFNSGTLQDIDPFLNNVSLPAAGDYYLRVSGFDGVEVGSNFWLVAAVAVPEPGSLSLLTCAAAVALGIRRRRRGKNG